MSFFKKALQHKEVYPLLGIVGFAGCFLVFNIARACLSSPDLIWNHNSNPTPWKDIRQTERKKMYSTHDYSSKRTEFPEVPEEEE